MRGTGQGYVVEVEDPEIRRVHGRWQWRVRYYTAGAPMGGGARIRQDFTGSSRWRRCAVRRAEATAEALRVDAARHAEARDTPWEPIDR